MNRLRLLSRAPAAGRDVAPEVKLAFVRDFVGATGDNPGAVAVLEALIPLFINKDPRNPAPE